MSFESRTVGVRDELVAWIACAALAVGLAGAGYARRCRHRVAVPSRPVPSTEHVAVAGSWAVRYVPSRVGLDLDAGRRLEVDEHRQRWLIPAGGRPELAATFLPMDAERVLRVGDEVVFVAHDGETSAAPASDPLGPPSALRRPARPFDYVITGRGAIFGSAAGGASISRSTDGGMTWSPFVLGDAVHADHVRLVMAPDGLGEADCETPEGLRSFATDDDGAHWQSLAPVGALWGVEVEGPNVVARVDHRPNVRLARGPLRWVFDPPPRDAGASEEPSGPSLKDSSGIVAGLQWLAWQELERDDPGLGHSGGLGHPHAARKGGADEPTLWETDLEGSAPARRLAIFPECSTPGPLGASPDGSIVAATCLSKATGEALLFVRRGPDAAFRQEAALHGVNLPPALERDPPPWGVRVGSDGAVAVLGATLHADSPDRWSRWVLGTPSGGYAEMAIGTDVAAVSVRGVAFTSQGVVVIGGFGARRTSEVRVSRNGGRSWRAPEGVPEGLDLRALAGDGHDLAAVGYRAARWTVGSEGSEAPEGPTSMVVLVSSDGGATWRERERAEDVRQRLTGEIGHLSMFGRRGLAVTSDGVFETTDAAGRWTPLVGSPYVGSRSPFGSGHDPFVCGEDACRVSERLARIWREVRTGAGNVVAR